MSTVTPQELLDAHPDVTVLSLDFFDTLATRRVAQPTHVFAVMEERLVAERGQRWHGFALRRVLAERAARREMSSVDEHADVTLGDIMCHLAGDLGLSPAERDELQGMERRTEIELTVPVEWGTALFREATDRGIRVLVVSDNYMPSAHIADVARAAGIELAARDIIVSCEHGAMKHDGSIWAAVIAAAGVSCGEILHVGDLHDADGAIPARFGIRTYVNASMQVSHREPLNTAPAVLPLSRVEARNRSGGATDPVINLAGGALAIIVAGQVLDIIRRSQETAVAGVHFTARDGYLAHRVYSRVREAKPGLPANTYTEISRSITWRASLTSVTQETIERFVGDDETMTMPRLRNRFGCGLVAEIDDNTEMEADTARAVVLSNAVILQESCADLRSRMLSYLAAQGVSTPGHHLVMDLGWSGSVVADLARLVRTSGKGDATFEGRLTALYWDASANRRTVNLHGLATDEFDAIDDNVRLLGTIRYFETLLTAPHGSVVDYRDGIAVHDPGHVVTVPGGLPWADFENAVVENAVSIILGTHPDVDPGEIDGNVVWATMMQVANTPTMEEVSVIGGMSHDTAIDHAGGGNTLVGSVPVGFRLEDVPSTYDALIRHHWLQGSLASWWADPSTRWIADEIRKYMPAVAPQWVRP